MRGCGFLWYEVTHMVPVGPVIGCVIVCSYTPKLSPPVFTRCCFLTVVPLFHLCCEVVGNILPLQVRQIRLQLPPVCAL